MGESTGIFAVVYSRKSQNGSERRLSVGTARAGTWLNFSY